MWLSEVSEEFMTMSLSQQRREVIHLVSGLSTVQNLTWAALSFGIITRLFQYFHNRTLWTDEAALALTTVERSYAELTGALGFVTGAPVGFLLLYRFAIDILGNNEFAIRLVPLLAGIGALLLFYPIAKHYLRPMAVPIAMALFGASTPLVRYATEGKQYSSDVFVGILLLYIGMQASKNGLAIRWLVPLALVGAALIWFSYPAVFVLAGIGGVTGIYALARKDWAKVIQLSLVSATWLVSFAISYQITAAETLVSNSGLIAQLDSLSRFPPFPPTSISDLNRLADSFFFLFKNPVGITLSGVAALAFLFGLASMFKANRFALFLLMSPLLMTFLVSSARLYPFGERWILFLAPFVIFFIAEGTVYIIDKTKQNYSLIGIGFAAMLLFYPLAGQLFHFIVPLGTDELKPIMNYVSTQRQEGDIVYVQSNARKVFWYYADRYGFEDDDYVVGQILDVEWESFETYVEELNEFQGNQRVWVIFNSGSNIPGLREGGLMVLYLDSIGTRDETFRAKNAGAFRYDLSAARPAETAAPSN